MFSVSLRSIYRTCDKIFVRNIRSRQYVPASNPGLNRRIRAFEKEGLKITDEDAEEFVEQSASDFYKVGEVYNEHLNETLMGKYELQHHIIKEKYFNENMPNLLTWSEKEQIRHLSEAHPDEWTPERLAESFPVTVPVVKKLLKYVWKPATEDRISRHDASVMRNWRELKEGTLEIPDDLREHFLKFSNRTIPPLNKKSVISKIEFTNEDKMGEFEQIIQKCAAQNNTKATNESSEQIYNSEPEELNKQEVRKDTKTMTLDELAGRIKKRLEAGKKVDVPDKLILNTLNTKDDIKINNLSTEIEIPDETSKDTNLVAFNEENKGRDIMNYPERIRIPKKAYKKDATYKVNDCYYDHDGRFLYRVLGMS